METIALICLVIAINLCAYTIGFVAGTYGERNSRKPNTREKAHIEEMETAYKAIKKHLDNTINNGNVEEIEVTTGFLEKLYSQEFPENLNIDKMEYRGISIKVGLYSEDFVCKIREVVKK